MGLAEFRSACASAPWPAVCFAAVVGFLLYFGLAPFAFHPPNSVDWSSSPPGLVFEGSGIAFSADPFSWPTEAPAEITLHLRVEAESQPRAGLGAILSLHDDHRQPRLLLAQYHDWLLLRVRSDPTSTRGREFWEIGAEFALPLEQPRLLTLTSGAKTGTSLYVDGELRRHDSRSIFGTDPPPSGRWVLGSTPTAQVGWYGRLQSFLAYPRVLDAEQIAAAAGQAQDEETITPEFGPMLVYQFPGAAVAEIPNEAISDAGIGPLTIPPTLEPLRRTVLRWPNRNVLEKNWFRRDATRNLIGFLPLGWLWMYARQRNLRDRPRVKTLLSAIAIGAGLSAVIELVQVFQPARISSMSDLALNTLGASIGAGTAFAVMRTRRAP